MIKLICPNCESDKIFFVKGNYYSISWTGERFICIACQEKFNESDYEEVNTVFVPEESEGDG
jgi:transposase-like protein